MSSQQINTERIELKLAYFVCLFSYFWTTRADVLPFTSFSSTSYLLNSLSRTVGGSLNALYVAKKTLKCRESMRSSVPTSAS